VSAKSDEKPDTEFNRQSALLTARMELQIQVAAYKSVLSLALLALKTSLLVNGAAAIATMSLLGATAEKRPELISGLGYAATAFAIGVLAAMIASGIGYVTQHRYASTGETNKTPDLRSTVVVVFAS